MFRLRKHGVHAVTDIGRRNWALALLFRTVALNLFDRVFQGAARYEYGPQPGNIATQLLSQCMRPRDNDYT